MRTSQTILATEKEAPHDAELIGHQLMLRAGLIRRLASGIYTWLPTGLRVLRKVENIVREEMNKSNANEILMPNIIPSELWHETERWDKFGPELLKLYDRNGREFCFGPTHEEVITDIARKEIKSYKQLPLNVYQIQTKFRDEIRPRFGVMRAREFIMKDAYSFHSSNECLGETYQVMYQTYSNILNRIGLKYRAVQADSGAIGGSLSHEFQVLAEAGEDIICYSNTSDYAANIELATYQFPDKSTRSEPKKSLKAIDTPDQKTIIDLCNFLNIPAEKTVKTLIIKDANHKLFALVLRGDHDLNEVKVEKVSQITAPFTFASDTDIQADFVAHAGNLGPVNSPIPIIVDHSAIVISDFVAGANEDDKHLTGVNWDRDIQDYSSADLRNVVEGDISPDGKGTLLYAKGIEVGHIFQLGTNYSEKMKSTILDKNGKAQPLIMGCYGFGVSRVIAAAIEQSYDENGIIWPKEIAPYQVIIIPMNMHKSVEVKEAAEKLYAELKQANVEVLFDDRNERAGTMFADADLIGIPHRVVIGKKGLEKGVVEYKARTSTEKSEILLNDILTFLTHN